jgi:secreted trypsin-like serine protease
MNLWVTQGDSGGPLVSGNKLIGLTSMGLFKSSEMWGFWPIDKLKTETCGIFNIGAFTQVSHYVRWIEEAKGQLNRGE